MRHAPPKLCVVVRRAPDCRHDDGAHESYVPRRHVLPRQLGLTAIQQCQQLGAWHRRLAKLINEDDAVPRHIETLETEGLADIAAMHLQRGEVVVDRLCLATA